MYGGQTADGPWTLFSHVVGADAPKARKTSYGREDTCGELSASYAGDAAVLKPTSVTAKGTFGLKMVGRS